MTGRRADCYHLLDSLVCFPAIGDALAAEPAGALSLTVEGPFAAGLAETAGRNLVLQAADLLATEGAGAKLILQKRLPLASGIGGGSADAAAALRLLSRLWSVPLPTLEELTALGADLPVCLGSRPARMRGIGERVDPLSLPPFWVVLVNPGRPVATAAVFAALACRNNQPLPEPPTPAEAGNLADWLRHATRNDLEPAARIIEPAVADAVAALDAQPGCRLARMSGSGATCFGMFMGAGEAARAEKALRRARPGWWVAAAPSEGGPLWWRRPDGNA